MFTFNGRPLLKCQKRSLSGLRQFALLAALSSGFTLLIGSPAGAIGTWTKVNSLNMPPSGPANITLLTDGRVLASGGDSTTSWNKWWTLTPDSNGSYATGTWSSVGSSSFGRLFNPAFILRDGKYWVCGGEYLCPAASLMCVGQDGPWSNCEVFDPDSNSWSSAPNLPTTDQMNDSPAGVLADGRIIVLGMNTSNSYLYSSLTTSWSSAAIYSRATVTNEGGSISLPDGSVLFGAYKFARYVPGGDTWVETTSTSTLLPDVHDSEPAGVDVGEFLLTPMNAEIGPFLLLHDGTVLILGGNRRNGIYNPSSNTWSRTDVTPPGPNPINKPYNHGDTPACVEPNGKVLTIVTDDQGGVGSTKGFFYEYNPLAALYSRWAAVSNLPFTAGGAGNPERTRLLALPAAKPGMIGSILVSGADSDGSYWVYTPDNNNGLGPQNSWRPTIAGSPVLVFGKFLVTGAQLNGLTTSGDFGDDGKIASNYPIATLVSSSGIARFCRTVIIGDMAPRRAPNSTGSFWFQAPVGIANGTYTVQVSASGLGLDSTNTPVQLTLPATDMGPALEVALSAPLI